MTAKERFLVALRNEKPDRLPVATHNVMPYFLDTYMDGISNEEFFEVTGMDPIQWLTPLVPQESDAWVIESETEPGSPTNRTAHRIITPKGTLSMITESNDQTIWLLEHAIKEKRDIELIAEFAPPQVSDAAAVKQAAEDYGDRGMIRGIIPTFEIFGQPGCWQDAACLMGIQPLIMASMEDPDWVHEFLGILQRRKLAYIDTLAGVPFDLIELGGGDASSSVISPGIFDEFVAPYDGELIARAQSHGQRMVYHTCGGMMPILESIAAMGPNAMETFTPPGMGGDTDLAEAHRRIGDKVCMIGGFDQFHFFQNCTPDDTRAEVRRCFEEAGRDGGFILCVSDHFFDAEVELIKAYVDEAKTCVY